MKAPALVLLENTWYSARVMEDDPDVPLCTIVFSAEAMLNNIVGVDLRVPKSRLRQEIAHFEEVILVTEVEPMSEADSNEYQHAISTTDIVDIDIESKIANQGDQSDELKHADNVDEILVNEPSETTGVLSLDIVDDSVAEQKGEDDDEKESEMDDNDEETSVAPMQPMHLSMNIGKPRTLKPPKKEKKKRMKSAKQQKLLSMFENNDKATKTSQKKKKKDPCPYCKKVIYPNDPAKWVESVKYHRWCFDKMEKERREAEKKAYEEFKAAENQNKDLSRQESATLITESNVKAAKNMWTESAKNPEAKVSRVCPICNEVILMHQEGFNFNGERYHQGCYKCTTCQYVFRSLNEKIIHRDKKPYCQRCYDEVFAADLKTATRVETKIEPKKVAGGGMVFDQNGAEHFGKLFENGIQRKRLEFVTITVEGDTIVYPEKICAMGQDAVMLADVTEDTLEEWLSVKVTRKMREELFAPTSKEEWDKFVEVLTEGDGPKIGWKTITYTDNSLYVARTREKTFMVWWNPVDVHRKTKVIFSSARDGISRRWMSGANYEAETLEELDLEAIIKFAQQE